MFNDDFWEIVIGRKEDIPRFLREVPLRHKDKIKKKNIIFDTKDATRWSEVESEVMALRKRISDEITRCKLEAEVEYQRRHSSLRLAPRKGNIALLTIPSIKSQSISDKIVDCNKCFATSLTDLCSKGITG